MLHYASWAAVFPIFALTIDPEIDVMGHRSLHCSDPFRAHVNWEWDHRIRVGDLRRDEQRRPELPLSATQNAAGDAITPRDLGHARVWLRRLFEDPAFIRVAEPSPMALARWRNDHCFALASF